MALKKLIDSRKRTPISFDQILLITGQGNAKMIDLDELKGHVTDAELFDKSNATCIICTVHDPAVDRIIRHWVSIVRVGAKRKYYYFLDSLGNTLDQLHDRLHTKHEGFFNWTKERGSQVKSYPKRLQKSALHTQDCGLWSAARCKLKKLTPKQFYNFWKGPGIPPDQIISMACFLTLLGTD